MPANFNVYLFAKGLCKNIQHGFCVHTTVIMKNVRHLIPFLLLLAAFAGCKKHKSDENKTSSLDTSAFIHAIIINAPPQFATTSVANDTLTVLYYENVSLLIPTAGYQQSFAIHLVEDFTNTSLKNTNYTTIDAYGDLTYDYVDDNLNDVSAKAIKDTMVNNVAMKKILVQRPFYFKKGYASLQAATAGQDSIDAVTTDNMAFHSFVYFTTTYPATTAGANLFYLKGK